MVDIGANIGIVSLAFLALGCKNVIAVEPQSALLRYLRASAWLQGWASYVHTFAGSVAYESGSIVLTP